MKETIDAGKVKIKGKTPPFQTKYAQAVEMLSKISATFRDTPLLVVSDSWFGNDDLFKFALHPHQLLPAWKIYLQRFTKKFFYHKPPNQ